MTKFEEYIKWKNKEVKYRPVAGAIEEIEDSIKKSGRVLAAVAEFIRSKDKDYLTLREMTFLNYQQLPKSNYRKGSAIKNLSRELITMVIFTEYPELNRRWTQHILTHRITRNQELALLQNVSEDLISFLGTPDRYSKKIGLDSRRVRMAEFWNFNKTHVIINDQEAIDRSVQLKESILYIDIRFGTVHNINNPEDVESLLDMKDWFVFGIEK